MADEEDLEVRRATETSAFGVGKRENHDASAFYARFHAPEISDDDQLGPAPAELVLPEPPCVLGDARKMTILPDKSVALVVTSPPYFVGKEYEQAVTGGGTGGPRDNIPESYLDYLEMLREVFAECKRVLEPGGRIAVNVANLGRKPYRSLAADVIKILQDDLGLLLRGEIIWHKADGATGSVAWGSFRKAANPVLRDITERVIVASKGRFDRARTPKQREADGYPHLNTVSTDEFMEATLDVWRIDPESARRVQHPAPFPVELPRRLIELYTYADDLVLDPFLGSGTTMVAALRTGRRAIGFDLDPDYVEIASERYETAKQRRPAGRAFVELDDEPLPMELFATPEARTEHFQERATREGKKAQDLAKGVLEEAGFKIIKEDVKLPKAGVQFNFLVEDEPGEQLFYVDVSGAFTTVRPGLVRTDTLWKTLGRAHVLKAKEPDAKLLVVTSNLPKQNSPGEKALRAVGPWSVFDAVEMFDPHSVARLRQYAAGTDVPIVGFWDEAAIEKDFDLPDED